MRIQRLAPCALLLSAIAAGCGGNAPHAKETDAVPPKFSGKYPMQVVCTIGQVAEMVERIGGEHVEVTALMGPGVDPHLYSPVTGDVRKLKAADAIFYNGLHLEGVMANTFEKLARTQPAYAVTHGIESRHDKRLREPPDFEGLYDPHVWHDPLLWSDCVQDVAEFLATFDPAHADDYKKNAEAYREELAELDEECRAELAAIPKDRRVLVTAHDAFGYFGAAYDVEVFGLKGISTEEEKDLQHQEAIQKMLVQRRIPAVFVESAVAPRTVKALVEPAQAAGLDLKIGGELYADALGPADSDAATYAGMIRHNVRTIAEALR
jgi:manganese/zinc/iron transport system substrate-binding protein